MTWQFNQSQQNTIPAKRDGVFAHSHVENWPALPGFRLNEPSRPLPVDRLEHHWASQLEHGWASQLEHGWAGQFEYGCWQACSCLLKQTDERTDLDIFIFWSRDPGLQFPAGGLGVAFCATGPGWVLKFSDTRIYLTLKNLSADLNNIVGTIMINQQPCLCMIVVRDWWNNKIERRCYNNHELGCCIKSDFACSNIHERQAVYCRFAKLSIRQAVNNMLKHDRMIEHHNTVILPILLQNLLVRIKYCGQASYLGHSPKRVCLDTRTPAASRVPESLNMSFPAVKYANNLNNAHVLSSSSFYR